MAALCGATSDDHITDPGHVASFVAENEIKMGPFTLHSVKMGDSMCSVDVFEMEQFQRLPTEDSNNVIRAMSVISLISLNGIMEIKAERN